MLRSNLYENKDITQVSKKNKRKRKEKERKKKEKGKKERKKERNREKKNQANYTRENSFDVTWGTVFFLNIHCHEM